MNFGDYCKLMNQLHSIMDENDQLRAEINALVMLQHKPVNLEA
jgi:hypothetical protein